MNLALQLELDNLAEDGEDPAYLREQPITYIGNKRALLPFIRQGIETVKRRLGKQKLDVLDLFSGTGVVARSLKSQCAKLVAKRLWSAISETTNRCYLSNRSQVDVGETGRATARAERRYRRGHGTRRDRQALCACRR
ncbi:DNA adenine methylase [Rhodanobacter lindaniclasticus]